MAASSTPRFLPHLRRRIRRERFLFLLIALLALLLLSPLLEGFVRLRLLMNLFYTVVLITAVYALSRSQRQLLFAVLLALPMLLSMLLEFTWTDLDAEALLTVAAGDILELETIFFQGGSGSSQELAIASGAHAADIGAGDANLTVDFELFTDLLYCCSL